MERQFISLAGCKRGWYLIFPVEKAERKKVILLLLLKFLISFVYSILTVLKDTVLVTASHSAAEVIPLVKGSIIFPISLVIIVLYTQLSNWLQQCTLFYSTILFFLSLIILYGFILYPNADKVSPHAMADWLNHYTEGGYCHWIALFRHWIHVLFFVVAELWGQLVIVLLYWSFVNNICKVQDAKRFYAIFIAAGDIALIVAAPLVFTYTRKYNHLDFSCTVQALVSYVALCCLAIVVIYRWVNHITQVHQGSGKIKQSKTLRLSLWDSLKHVLSSRYLGGMTILVVSCALSMNIVEGTWKSYLKEAFPKAADYQSWVSLFNFWTGMVASLFSLFFSGGILRKFGWKTAARISPIVIGVMGTLFFLMSYGKNSMPSLTHWLGVKLLLYIVIFGGIQNVMAKSVKYTFFDKTTQIAYIPLDPESKVKGKAAVDLLGSRLGKAGSSWIQIVLLHIFNTTSIQPLSGILFFFLLITTIVWYVATGYVDKQLSLLEMEEK